MQHLEIDTLSGRYVALEPLSAGHVAEITAAGSGDRGSYGYTQVPSGRQETENYVAHLLGDAAVGKAAPFVQRQLTPGSGGGDDTGKVVGCTRFMNPAWPLRREHPDEVEIGGTWLNPAAQRSALNTEAKLLLLTHAFEVWNVQRVAICTDAANGQSRRAIERIGATLDGILPLHRSSFQRGRRGTLRDSALYSITVPQWAAVRAHLEFLIGP